MVGDPQVGLVAGSDERDFDALRIGAWLMALARTFRSTCRIRPASALICRFSSGTVISTR